MFSRPQIQTQFLKNVLKTIQETIGMSHMVFMPTWYCQMALGNSLLKSTAPENHEMQAAVTCTFPECAEDKHGE